MESRDKLLERLDKAQKGALGKLDSKIERPDPAAIMLQQGANAPIVATAVTVIAEVLIDIRDELARVNEGLTALSVGQSEALVAQTGKASGHVCVTCGRELHEHGGKLVCLNCDFEEESRCPKCKSTNTVVDTQPEKVDDKTLDYALSYVCNDCGHKWSGE